MTEFSVVPGSASRLSREASPYLRSASHQPVRWYPWGDEAFQESRKLNKPILLDVGAVWCHWCHVMDSESYENETIAGIINEYYVAVKVDRDERPDVDSRYQSAVSAISGQGGWPLTAFLTPQGQVFYGGTYFPPEDRYGRIGFPKLLTTLARAFHNEPEKVIQNAQQIDQALRSRQDRIQSHPSPSESLIQGAVKSILSEFDSANGGFGGAPKFPHCSAIELLLSLYDRSKDQRMMDAIRLTLVNMSKGGIYDQLGGGFHRYSTDERWGVPHFEKMLYDNAPLLTNYVHAYQATREPFFRDVALDIVRYVGNTLMDQEAGGFYASQDADVKPGDDGSYFTWSLEQAKSVLAENELGVLELFFGIQETGKMHHDKSQNVLSVEKSLDEISDILKIPAGEVSEILARGKDKLVHERSMRKPPFVDKTIYANWNGMMISSYLDAYKAFETDELLRDALRALERILREHVLGDETISHGAASSGSEGFLDDQVEFAGALISAFEVTTKFEFLDRAATIMRRTIDSYGDDERGGFFDVPKDRRGPGLMSIQNKPLQDSPVASPNSVALDVLNRLYAHTGEPRWRNFAAKCFECFSGPAADLGIFSSHFHVALNDFLHPAPHIVIISTAQDQRGRNLLRAALETYRPGKTVACYEPGKTFAMPGILSGKDQSYSTPVAYVCSQFICASPVFEEQALASTLLEFGRS